MKQRGREKDTADVAKIMIGTLLSTTARMFVPTLGLFGVGVVVDLTARTRPIGMIVGAALGIGLAFWLVHRQWKAANLVVRVSDDGGER
ncbi:MAG: AtpZ/AtpI family protein [Candidatus Nomurabacteria bacterium]|jgi:F0F1-type ATP synthase assembly protein I|nr:AtpZ/AtpI family protein [Candidatus Nomurabacteria bacterium]